MASGKAKKPRLTENNDAGEDLHSDDPDAFIDSQVIVSIEKLQEIQDDLDKVNEEASEKVLEVEQKYNEIRMPVYARRNDIIKSIPDFWLTAFMSHPTLAEHLTDEDHMIFKHLQSLEVEDFKDVKSGYSITMNFSSNPYFKDKKLSKTYSFSDDGTTTITGTPIEWKDLDVTKGGSQKKGNKRTLAQHSFFSWFSETQQKDHSDDSYDESDLFDVAEIIKEELWPNPLKYFINETDNDSDDDEEDDEEKNEDGGSDENNDDQEENGDEEDDG